MKKKNYLFQNIWFLSGAFTLLYLISVYLFVPLAFFNPDDRMAMFAIAGYYNGTEQIVFPFINVVYCGFVGFFYKLFPSVAWYPIIMEAFTVLSCFFLNACLLNFAQRKRYPLWIAEAVCGAVFFGLLLPLWFTINFTTAAIMCAIGAISLLLLAHDATHIGKKLFFLALSAVFLFFAYIIRSESGLVGICFYALLLVYLLLDRRSTAGSFVKKVLPTILCLCIVLSAVVIADTVDSNLKDTEDYRASSRWNSARSALVDFDNFSYEDNPEFFEQLGWSEEYYDLVMAFYFADDKCDTEQLALIHKQAVSEADEASLAGILSNMVQTVLSFALSPYYFSFFLALLVLSVIFVCIALKKKAKLLSLAYLVCTLGGMVLMWLYLTHLGRFVGHVFRVATIPAILLILCGIGHMLPERHESAASRPELLGWSIPFIIAISSSILTYAINYSASRILRLSAFGGLTMILFFGTLVAIIKYHKPQKRRGYLSCIAVIFTAVCCWALITFTTIGIDPANEKIHQQQVVIEQYVLAHPEDVFVSANFVNDKYAFTVFPEEKPTNLNIIFDYLKHTNAYHQKMEMNGLADITIAAYFEDNVYYIGQSENDHLLDMLLSYMRKEFGETVQAEAVHVLDQGVSVYQFSR